MNPPTIIAIIVLALLACALLWIWMPRLIRRRRDFPPQHAHRRGPAGISSPRIWVSREPGKGVLTDEDAEWMIGNEPDWNWPRR